MKIEGSIRPQTGPAASTLAGRSSAWSARPSAAEQAKDSVATAAAVGRAEKSGQPPTTNTQSALSFWSGMLAGTLDTMMDDEAERMRGLVAKVYSDMAKLGAALPGGEADGDAEAGAAEGGVDSSI